MKNKKKADPQLEKLYAWEEEQGWNDSRISFTEAQSVVHRACWQFRVKPPEVRLHRTRALPWSDPESNLMSLQEKRYLNVPITLHEAAHHILWHRYGGRPQDHGPKFMGIYMYLLEWFDVERHGVLLESVQKAGLKYELVGD